MKKPLSREELMQVIEGKGKASRVPMLYHFWVFPEVFQEKEDQYVQLLDKYPTDMQVINVNMPSVFDAPEDDGSYRWANKDRAQTAGSVGLDAVVAIEDWAELDDVLAHFPNADYAGLFREKPQEDGRYRGAFWCGWLFERLWSLRGMENALTDFYLYPEEIHRVFQAFTDFDCRVLERCKRELHTDGIVVTDDIGTQNGPFFSEEIFLTFFKPYYKRLIDKAHSLGMHLWMHSCGNIESYLPHLIEIGLDVIHPIQKYTMDQQEIARKFGGDISIWAGFDVQQVIPYGSPEEVRAEVRRMIDTYFREDGRFMLTCGNALTIDCKLASLEALLEESYAYGSRKAGVSLEKGE